MSEKYEVITEEGRFTLEELLESSQFRFMSRASGSPVGRFALEAAIELLSRPMGVGGLSLQAGAIVLKKLADC
jgi:hypothetical protein